MTSDIADDPPPAEALLLDALFVATTLLDAAAQPGDKARADALMWLHRELPYLLAGCGVAGIKRSEHE